MKVYLMNTNAGRNMVINEYNNWYYFAYVINGCDIGCDDLHEAIENLEKHIKTIYINVINECDIGCDGMHEAIENLENYIKTIYTNGDVIDISNFENISEYDGLDACSLLRIINSTEIRQGVTHGDLSTMYFICDTDAIKGGEN